MPPLLEIKNIGQISDAQITFGDLTVFVGPQATGKSVCLQILKLLLDTGHIQRVLNSYGIDWRRDFSSFLDVYFGEGMRFIWRQSESQLKWNRKKVDLQTLVGRQQSDSEEAFFIPAQRVLALRDGWPRPFSDYLSGDPFTVREFSEKLRRLLEEISRGDTDIFPRERQFKRELRELVQRNLFPGFELKIDTLRSQKRLVLGPRRSKNSLPFMVWSAGQREFVPLLLGLYC